MKRWIVSCVLALGLISCFGLRSNAAAEGLPTGLLVTGDGWSAVGLIDFNEGDFTKAEVDELADLIQSGSQRLLEFLKGKVPGFSANTLVYGPDLLTSIGLGDAAAANDYILNNMNLLNAEVYVKAVATRVTPPQGSGAPGNNIRLDFYVYHEKLGNELRYVGSLEVLEIVIDAVRGLRNLF